VAEVVNINDVLNGHTLLDLDCLDRIYLNAYVPALQVGGQVVRFLTKHLGNPVPSPALCEQIGNRFRNAVKAFAEERAIPILRLKKPDRRRWDDRKLDHVHPYLKQARAPGVVAIVVAQEFQWVFTAQNRATKPGAVSFDFQKAERRVTTYYFYVLDAEFGPGFIKICSYFPYPAKIGRTGTSGPSARPAEPASPITSWPTALPPAANPNASRPSATVSAPPIFRPSATAGSPSSPHH